MIFGNVLHIGQIKFRLIKVIFNIQIYDKLNPAKQKNDVYIEHELFGNI